MENVKYQSVSDYLKAQPPIFRKKLKELRKIVLEYAPGAEELISYHMPAVKVNGKMLLYYAAAKEHIGFYAMPTAHKAFTKELSKYKTGKGSVQFPMDQELPGPLIARMIKFRMKEINKKKDEK